MLTGALTAANVREGVVTAANVREGVVTAAFGRHYEVTCADGRIVSGIPRGKKSPYACGDRVALGPSHGREAQILAHEPRTSLLYRSDRWKEKLIAANATQIVLVVATEPAFSPELISRALVAAAHQTLRALVVLNKCDLSAQVASARARLAPFVALGLPVIELAARIDATPLAGRLGGELSVLVGQSGMGKSTLVNALAPEAAAATREISIALDSGKHTTTHARLYALPGGGGLIDSPGLQEFGLAHLARGEVELGFTEFLPHLGQCRFRDCRHENDPGCALRRAVADGKIDARRLAHFVAIAGENARATPYA
ncbi:MAG: ribosome small subunit-dependent GTPase A [Sulfuritalea sp.]|nr:ribosome small subunit-dependent GTPase A [Sulfuritalea sp.]